jgi:hypothetical protein
MRSTQRAADDVQLRTGRKRMQLRACCGQHAAGRAAENKQATHAADNVHLTTCSRKHTEETMRRQHAAETRNACSRPSGIAGQSIPMQMRPAVRAGLVQMRLLSRCVCGACVCACVGLSVCVRVTRNYTSSADNMNRITSRKQQTTPNRQRVDDGQQTASGMAACSRQHAADNTQQTTCSRQHAADNTQQTTCSRQHTADNAQQTACSGQLAGDNMQQTACSRRRKSDTPV